MKTLRFSYFLLPTLLLLSSCRQIVAPEVRSVVCCDLKKTNKSEVAVTFDLEVHNGNNFPIKIKRYDLDVMLEGNLLGSSREQEPLTLEAGVTKSLEVTVSVTSKELVNRALTMGLNTLFNKKPKQLEVEVVGYVVGSAKGFSRRVRIREKYPINLQM